LRQSPTQCSGGPKVLSFAEAAQAQGILPLYLDRSELAALFPAVAAGLPALQVAQILATTRLAGMECPGWHSLYHALNLRFVANAETPDLHYRVCRSDERFSVIELAVRSRGLEGKVATFLRPPPVVQPALAEVAAAVQPGEFRGQRALVVGGSRGLGELTAKIIAAGSGAVCITYHRGKDDAERIVRELSEAGVACRSMSCDVTAELPVAAGEELAAWRPTHVYYFATPHIGASQRGKGFSSERFDLFCRYYLAGLTAVLAAVGPPADGILRVLYPSSVYVETPAEGLAEYAAAKAAGEVLCRYLQQQTRNLRIYAPRLPRLPTDQTAGIGPQKMADAVEVMLREIRALERT
jgi:NAD(P)-dependent dehydrogenase (short-subunit alcohol dehydrogenase family)